MKYSVDRSSGSIIPTWYLLRNTVGRLLQRNFPTSSTLPIVILSGRTKSFLLSMSTMTFNFTICTFQTFKKLVQFYHKPHSLTFLGPKQDIVCLSNQNMYYFYMSMVVRLDLFGIRVSVYGACIWLWLMSSTGLAVGLKVFPIDSTSNRYNRRYSSSFGDYWLDLFSSDWILYTAHYGRNRPSECHPKIFHYIFLFWHNFKVQLSPLWL